MGTPYLRHLVKGRKQHATTTNDQTEWHTKTTHDRRPFCSLGYASAKSARQKRREQIPSPGTICRKQSDGTFPRKWHHRIRKRESVHQDKGTTGSATEFHLQVVYGRERWIKKWHISCHFRVFTGTFRAVFGVLMISRKPQALPGLSRKVIAVSPYALWTFFRQDTYKEDTKDYIKSEKERRIDFGQTEIFLDAFNHCRDHLDHVFCPHFRSTYHFRSCAGRDRSYGERISIQKDIRKFQREKRIACDCFHFSFPLTNRRFIFRRTLFLINQKTPDPTKKFVKSGVFRLFFRLRLETVGLFAWSFYFTQC